jgi:hypothetical protein
MFDCLHSTSLFEVCMVETKHGLYEMGDALKAKKVISVMEDGVLSNLFSRFFYDYEKVIFLILLL